MAWEIDHFQVFLERRSGNKFANYQELHQYSVSHIGEFWSAIWDFFDVQGSKGTSDLVGDDMLTRKFFPEAELNFAENLLAKSSLKIKAFSENGLRREISYQELMQDVVCAQQFLKKSGIGSGDVVAGFITNSWEAIVGMLATSSLGAIWTSCSPDFGVSAVLDRFGQVRPKALLTIDGTRYNGKDISLVEKINDIRKGLGNIPGLIFPTLNAQTNIEGFTNWKTLPRDASQLHYTRVPFDHPLYIMYSSGTTGKPKCIVHGHGGTLLQHLKELGLHSNITAESKIMFYSTCGWMMWNWVTSSLALGSTLVTYEGSPAYPKSDAVFDLARKEKLSHLGTSPKYLGLLKNEDITLGSFPDLKFIIATGSPVLPEHYEYVETAISSKTHLMSICGGTDILGCFMLGNPTLPVKNGEIQCLGLGMDVQVFDSKGKHLPPGQKGELVCASPFPSQPITFWNAPEKYKAAYFERFPGVWHHGDFIEITSHHGVVVYGRSDATLNPGGVRIGTAEIYQVLEKIPEVSDSLCVGQPWENDQRIILFVVLKKPGPIDEELTQKIRQQIRKELSPRHIPAIIESVQAIPYTVSGKKVEIAVTRILSQEKIDNRESLANPEALNEYQILAQGKLKIHP